jgi:hypothetical protein
MPLGMGFLDVGNVSIILKMKYIVLAVEQD